MNVLRAVWCLVIFLSVSIVSAAPFLEGRVTDEEGRPIAGATVKIWDCFGTCWGGTAVLSDAEGHYVFEKKPFQNLPNLTVDLPGRYEVSRALTGPALEEQDSSTPRHVDFVLGTPAAAYVRLEGDVPEGWKQTMLIRPGRDIKLPRNDFGTIDDGEGKWGSFELLPRNETLHLVLVREPIVRPSDDPQETRERQRENWRNRVEIISPPFRLIEPQRYDIRASVAPGTEGAPPSIIVESVSDALGNDRTGELTINDPNFGPPVDAAMRQKALKLLERVKLAASPWNAAPDHKIAAYEYDFIAEDGEKTHVKIDGDSPLGPAWSDISRQHGFAYMPPLRWLFSQPENVVILGMEVNDGRAVVRYRLKSSRGFGAGLGIGPWNGFFTSSFSAGMITIDVKNATVLEHRLWRGPLGKETVETFGEYVSLGNGYAPQSLRIQSGGQDFRLMLRVYQDTLWLLDEAFHGEEQKPAAKIENVLVKLTG